jgi:hypothetical protein
MRLFCARCLGIQCESLSLAYTLPPLGRLVAVGVDTAQKIQTGSGWALSINLFR